MVILKGLARDKIRVDIPEGFVRQAEKPPLRKAYLDVRGAVEKTIYENVSLNNAVILHDSVVAMIPDNDREGVHYSSVSWTTASGPPPKPKGRTLIDPSHPVGVAHPLNSDWTRENIVAKMGEIVLPTVVMLARAICRMAEKLGGWNRIRLWKRDLKGAFTLIDFDPASVRLLALGLTGGRTYFPLAGIFGLSIMPFIFNVASKVLSKAINLKIFGEVFIYVDDLMGITDVAHLESDMHTAISFSQQMFGDDAVEFRKMESGQKLVFIGWEFDASAEAKSFSLSDKNLSRAIYGFFDVNIDRGVAFNIMETLASLASRYALVCPWMRPYTGHLYATLKGQNDRAVLHLLPAAKACILRWRAFFCLLILDPKKYRRPIADLETAPSDFLIEYDSSLTGLGVRIFQLGGMGRREETLVIVAGLDTPFQLKGDSSFQNTMEFMAVVLGLGLLAKEGVHNARFRLRGDSRTSLAWAKKHRFKPGPSEATASAFLLFNQVCGLCMGEEDNEFILGLINVECDGLSRGKTPAQLGYDPSIIRSILPGDTLTNSFAFVIHSLGLQMKWQSVNYITKWRVSYCAFKEKESVKRRGKMDKTLLLVKENLVV